MALIDCNLNVSPVRDVLPVLFLDVPPERTSSLQRTVTLSVARQAYGAKSHR